MLEAPFAYNVMLGRPAITTFMVVASALHQKIKFPVKAKLKKSKVIKK